MKGRMVVIALLLASPAFAEAPTRELRETLGASVNNLGLQNTLDLSWRWRLYDRRHPLFSDAHFSVGLSKSLSPSYLRLGAWVAYAPVSVLELKAGVEPVYYFGVMGSLIGFRSLDDDFDKDARRALKDQAVPGLGGRFYLAPTLRAKVGRVIASSGVEFEWWEVDAPGSFFYEPTRDTLLSSEGEALMRGSSVVLYELDEGPGRKLMGGLHHGFTLVYDAPRNSVHRLGALGIWVLDDRRFGVREPSVLLNLFYYLDDPFKKGEVGAALAVRFQVGH